MSNALRSPLVLGIAGALVGLPVGLSGVVGGLVIGVLWARLNTLRERLSDVERQLQSLATPPAPAHVHPIPIAPIHPLEAPPAAASHASASVGGAEPHAARAPRPPGTGVGQPATSILPDFADTVRKVVAFCTTGNVLAKIGVVVLFFGLAFLLRFAADQGLLPIEFRLIGVTAGAIVLLGAGWRLRRSHQDWAMAAQGGAVGILYLTIFVAFRLYALVPALLTFALMLAVVVLSGALAVLQNQSVLAVLGASGGFLAPILASTGEGSHVTLFSYYLVLNAGVVGLAWFRAWRVLNWLGFVFTFGIGLFWGSEYYQPAFFRSTEPFLIVFFLFYVAVSVLFARRQPPALRGYVDGSLVFGLPAVAFTMQSVLVADIPFGRAYSAVAVSGLYVSLARGLWRREAEQRPLAEAFLALGVVFLTLAIPLAFDGHAAAAGWALEGAALVWIGFRQHRILARTVGSLLLEAAGLAFVLMADATVGAIPVVNSRFLGCAAIAVGSVTAAYHYFKASAVRRSWETPVEWVLLAWGLMWWAGAVVQELYRFSLSNRALAEVVLAALVLCASATSVVLAVLARRLRWPALRHATAPLLPLIAVLLLAYYLDMWELGPWANFGWLAWPASLATSYLLLWWFESNWMPRVVQVWHVGTTWLLIFLATWASAVAVGLVLPEAPVWQSAVWAMAPAAATLGLLWYGNRLTWPVGRFPWLYTTVVPLAPLSGVLLSAMWALTQSGEAAPLPYVPIVNPLEVAQSFGLLTALMWWTRFRPSAVLDARTGHGVLGFIAFLAMNAIVGRIVHFYLGVPFELDALAGSFTFQAGVSVLWAVTATSLMGLARRRFERSLWFAGAALLGALVGKLFLVDLRGVGGIARIVSFLVTGLLVLAIGYFSPAPPRVPREETVQ
jgi:uncharacterized membrane protein